MDELAKFLKFYHFDSFEDAIREAGAELLEDLNLEIDDLKEVCDVAKMDDDEQKGFFKACAALKNGAYPPPSENESHIDVFLEKYKLIKYSQALQDNGLSQLKVLKSMNDEAIKALATKSKLAVLHRKKFIAACNQLKNGNYVIDNVDNDKNDDVVDDIHIEDNQEMKTAIDDPPLKKTDSATAIDDPGSDEHSKEMKADLVKSVTSTISTSNLITAEETTCHSKQSILDCQSFDRLLKVLDFYNQNKKSFDQEYCESALLMDYVREEKIDMVADLGHVVQWHFNDKKKKKNEKEKDYGLAHRKLCAVFGVANLCELVGCHNYGRNNRDRAVKDISKETEKNFVADMLDTIHVLFCHSYDTGYRLSDGFGWDTDSDVDDEKTSAEATCVDDKYNKITKKMIETKKQLLDLRGKDRMEQNKFNTEVNPEMHDSRERDSRDERPAISDYDEISYSFGLRCYYWKYYQNNEDVDRHYHPHEQYMQWFVKPKYDTLKEEIMNTPAKNLSLECYTSVTKKAKEWIGDEQITILQCQGSGKDDCNADKCDEYQIKENDPVSLRHLICLVCYTDYSNFSYHFSKSFRKTDVKETDEEFRIRKRDHHWLSKGLRELVELYGTTMNASKIEKFYTGISCEVVFPTLVCRLYGPTSTTAQISVATAFAKQSGMIVTLNKNYNGGRLKYFDCSFVSCYANEDERLFLGGLYPMKFGNVISVKAGHNYIKFVGPITKFAQVYLKTVDSEHKATKFDSKVICALIDHYLNNVFNKFVPYINSLFKCIMENTKFIQIDVHCFKKKAKEFALIFCSDKKKFTNMIKIHDLSMLMQNLDSVCLQWRSDVDGFDIDEDQLQFLSMEVKKLSKNSLVNEIKILNIQEAYEKNQFELFQKQIAAVNFCAQIEKRCEGEDNDEIPCLLIRRNKK